jgi:hypothetical protein
MNLFAGLKGQHLRLHPASDNTTDISDIELGYLECALWTSTDGEYLDVAGYGVEDIAPETRKKMRAELTDFVLKNQALLKASGLGDTQIGHDFWLTRNGHGAGFWDRGLGAIGEQLTTACKAYPSVDLYVGDDGKIHQ